MRSSRSGVKGEAMHPIAMAAAIGTLAAVPVGVRATPARAAAPATAPCFELVATPEFASGSPSSVFTASKLNCSGAVQITEILRLQLFDQATQRWTTVAHRKQTLAGSYLMIDPVSTTCVPGTYRAGGTGEQQLVAGGPWTPAGRTVSATLAVAAC